MLDTLGEEYFSSKLDEFHTVSKLYYFINNYYLFIMW